MLRGRPGGHCTLAAKYSITAYTYRTTVGSCYALTQGPLRQEIVLQLHLKF